MQVYVPGTRLSKTLGVPWGKGVALASPVHWIVAVVAPATNDWKLTVIRESGVSLNESPNSLPLPQVASVLTLTVCVVVSLIWYPVGAPVSFTS